MATKIGIDASYILTCYPNEVEAIIGPKRPGEYTDRNLPANNLATIVAKIVPVITEALKKDIPFIPRKIDYGTGVHYNNIIPFEDALRTIFKKSLGIELEETPAYTRRKANQEVYSREVEYKVSWKRSQSRELKILFGIEDASESKATSMNEFRKKNTYCDCTFIVENQQFRAHKAHLAASSDYFHCMFSSGLSESKKDAPIPFGDAHVRARIFELLLTYIYTRDVDLTKSTVDDLMQLVDIAKETLHDDLCVLCIAQLRTLLTKENFYDIARFAVLNESTALIDDCRCFLAKHKDLLDSLDFQNMSSHELVVCTDIAAALQSEALQKTGLTYLYSKIDEAHFEEVCDAACTSRREEVQKPLKEQAFAFATKNIALLAKAEMQKAKEAYTALMTGLGRPTKQPPARS